MIGTELTEELKRTALEMGVAKVGIAGVENLAGPPEADPEPVLSGTRSVISFFVVEPEEKVMDYLSKRDPGPYRAHFYENIQTLGRVGLALADTLRARGHRAEPLSPNGVYKSGSNVVRGLKPPFAHRYAAVAAGLGAIGLSGNVMTPEYGARIYLSSVLTDAPLEPDRPLDDSPCDDCNICLNACPGRFMSLKERVTFTLGGRQITHAKRGLHARCALGCGCLTGLSRDGKWSTWAPARHPIPEDDGEMLSLLRTLFPDYINRRREHPELPNFYRLSAPMEGYPPEGQGVLARTKFDTETTCGACAIVCFETLDKRAAALKALRTSGVVVEDEDGTVRVVRPQEVP
jgi:epoxyqueuosine reductase QueG